MKGEIQFLTSCRELCIYHTELDYITWNFYLVNSIFYSFPMAYFHLVYFKWNFYLSNGDPMTPYTPPFWGLARITGANGGS